MIRMMGLKEMMRFIHDQDDGIERDDEIHS